MLYHYIDTNLTLTGGGTGTVATGLLYGNTAFATGNEDAKAVIIGSDTLPDSNSKQK